MAEAPFECLENIREKKDLLKKCEICEDKCNVDIDSLPWDCFMDFGTGPELQGGCQICLDNKEHLRGDEISPWTLHILSIRKLQQGGYPYRKNDLELEEWQDLGDANETIEQINQKILITALIPKANGL